jgi:hypothetical protein
VLVVLAALQYVGIGGAEASLLMRRSEPVEVGHAFAVELKKFLWAGKNFGAGPTLTGQQKDHLCQAIQGYPQEGAALARLFAGGLLSVAVLQVTPGGVFLDGEELPLDAAGSGVGRPVLAATLKTRRAQHNLLLTICSLKTKRPRMLILASASAPFTVMNAVHESLQAASLYSHFYWVRSAHTQPLAKGKLLAYKTVEPVQSEPTKEDLIRAVSATKLLGFMHPFTWDISGRELGVNLSDAGDLTLELRGGEPHQAGVEEIAEVASAITGGGSGDDEAAVGCAWVKPGWSVPWGRLARVFSQLHKAGAKHSVLRPPASAIGKALGWGDAVSDEPLVGVNLWQTIAVLHPSQLASERPREACDWDQVPGERGECNPTCERSIFGGVGDSFSNDLGAALRSASGIAVGKEEKELSPQKKR